MWPGQGVGADTLGATQGCGQAVVRHGEGDVRVRQGGTRERSRAA